MMTTRRILLTGAAAAGAASVAAIGSRSSASEAFILPPPAFDPPSAGTTETAALAGGCFWGVQGVFQHVAGVTNAVSGYAGGEKKNADYGAVSRARTAHAEAVRISFDPRVVSYGRLLQIFFSVAHDPTQLNRQGPDVGPHYRSAIFPASDEQARIAKTYIAQLDAARIYRSAIVTTIESGKEFYPAENYHQDFMTKNPTHPYIVHHDRPKIENLKRLFADRYRVAPVLVATAGLEE